MPKNFDPTVDFDALLADFKTNLEQTKRELKDAQFDGAKYGKIQAKHESWVKKNITEQGLRYELDPLTREPTCLYVVVAGSKKLEEED